MELSAYSEWQTFETVATQIRIDPIRFLPCKWPPNQPINQSPCIKIAFPSGCDWIHCGGGIADGTRIVIAMHAFRVDMRLADTDHVFNTGCE